MSDEEFWSEMARGFPRGRLEVFVKFALLTVSYAGLFYDGPALSVVDQVRKARQLGFDGLSIETKRPVASPLERSTR